MSPPQHLAIPAHPAGVSIAEVGSRIQIPVNPDDYIYALSGVQELDADGGRYSYVAGGEGGRGDVFFEIGGQKAKIHDMPWQFAFKVHFVSKMP